MGAVAVTMGASVRLSHVNAEPAMRDELLGSTVMVGSASWLVSALRLFGTIFTRRSCARQTALHASARDRTAETHKFREIILLSPSHWLTARAGAPRRRGAARRRVRSRNKPAPFLSASPDLGFGPTSCPACRGRGPGRPHLVQPSAS